MTLVKICGVNCQAAYAAAAEAGADYIGFVFFEKSPRFVTPEQAARLGAPGRPVARMGLFVEPTAETVAAALRLVPLDGLQIYGSAALCRQIRAASGVQTWRAIGVAAASDLPSDAEGLDGFIIEPQAPQGASRPGGNALALDFSLLAGWRAPALWLLAGGLTPANVAQAIALSGAPGVDVSSGVETAPGEKSPALIRDFIARAKTARADSGLDNF